MRVGGTLLGAGFLGDSKWSLRPWYVTLVIYGALVAGVAAYLALTF